MLLSLHWWAYEYQATEVGQRYRRVRHRADGPDERTADGYGVILVGGIGRARAQRPATAAGEARLLLIGLANALTRAPAPEPLPEPEPLPPPPVTAAGVTTLALDGYGLASAWAPVVGTASARIRVIVFGDGLVLLPMDAGGAGRFGVSGRGTGSVVHPQEPPPRKPWSTPMTTAEADSLAIIAALYLRRMDA